MIKRADTPTRLALNQDDPPEIPSVRHALKSSFLHLEAFRTILVHVEASQDSDERLRAVVELAYEIGANVLGVGGCAPFYMQGINAIDWQILVDQEAADTVAAEAHFAEIAGPLGHSANWCSAIGSPNDVISQTGAIADLMAVGARPGPADSTVNAGALALTAGIPVLAIPSGCTTLAPKRIILAWKNTREARRAVTDAMPFLRHAEEVLVVSIQSGTDGAVDGLASIVERLRRHCVTPQIHNIAKSSDNPAAELISCAEEHSADLIVSGAYGHSRLREWCFGGATSGLLERSTVPVLFSH